MKIEVAILDGSYSVNEDECTYIPFIASKSPKDLFTITSHIHRGVEDNEDVLLDSYN